MKAELNKFITEVISMENINELDNNDLKKNISEECDSTIQELETLHKILIDESTNIGFAIEAAEQAKANYLLAADMVSEVQELQPVINSGLSNLIAIRNQVSQIRTTTVPIAGEIKAVANTLGGTVTISGSVLSTIMPAFDYELNYPASLSSDVDHVYNVLSTFSPALGQTYKQIDEVYFGTTSDNL